MNDILRKIFDGEYNVTPERDEKQQELGRKLGEEWEKVHRMLGDEFMDPLFTLEAEQDDWRSFQYYRAGVRLGVRLMLEALGD